MSLELQPQFYTEANAWAVATAAQFIARGPGAEWPDVFYVADIDDTLLNSNLQWYEDYVAIARQRRADGQIVNLDTFKQLTPRACFIGLGFTHGEYDAYKTERMHSVDFHQNMQALGNVCLALADFRHSSYLPGAYLSTRPAVLGDATKQNLEALNFASVPLLVRSIAYDYASTISFKLQALAELRDIFDTLFLEDLPITYIDDYIGVVQGVRDLGRPGLNAVLFDGDQTWAQLLPPNP